MKSVLLCLLVILGGWFVMPAEALAASCPYCHQVYGEPAPGDEARVYALRRDHERTCPSRPRPGNGGGNSGNTVHTCAVVTIYNRTSNPIYYSITVNGQWQSSTVQPNGGSYYHWQYPPRNFSMSYDYSYDAGMQKKSYSLGYYTVRTSEPSASDGRAYEFYESGGLIGFGSVGSQRTTPGPSTSSPGTTTRPEPPPPITNPIGSVTGNGSGTANSATDPSSASGSFSLSAITPKGGEFASGTWKAMKRTRKVRRVFRVYTVSDWVFTLKLDGRDFQATVDFQGEAGTSASFPIVFPCSRGPNQTIRIQFGVQFSGDSVRLMTFRKTG
ncbi:MAG TPA: hypothetical protein VMY42_22310 [Thermoguttaceae bacterium]|nr:hypothetical protein [Thermoguttaceae bacterium]